MRLFHKLVPALLLSVGVTSAHAADLPVQHASGTATSGATASWKVSPGSVLSSTNAAKTPDAEASMVAVLTGSAAEAVQSVSADTINRACRDGLPKSIDVTSDDLSRAVATGTPLFEVSAAREHSDLRCSFVVKATEITPLSKSNAYSLGLSISEAKAEPGFHLRKNFIKTILLRKDANGQFYGTLADSQDKDLFPVRLIN